MKIIDLSVTILEDIKEPLPITIVYEDHKEGAKKMGGKLFQGLTDVFMLDACCSDIVGWKIK